MRSSSIFFALLQLEATWAQPQILPPPPGCAGCPFNVQALEEFSVDYTAVSYELQADSQHTLTGFTTTPLSHSDNFPSEHGTIALNARNLQLKLDSHAAFPQGFALGPVPVGGMHLHEEIHINGAASQASLHFESPMLNFCIRMDHLPPVPQSVNGMVDMYLQQGEQMGPAMLQQMGTSLSVDGEHVVGVLVVPGPLGAFFTESTHPKFFTEPVPPDMRGMYQRMLHLSPSDDTLDHIGVKLDHYESSVGNQFGVRACSIEDHSATQSLLSANPEAREFVHSRIVQHQRRLQAVLEPVGLNTRFNLIPLEIADLMVPPAPHCANDELAQIPGRASTLEVAAVSVCSFVIGIAASFAVLRKRTVTLVDDYHQVSA